MEAFPALRVERFRASWVGGLSRRLLNLGLPKAVLYGPCRVVGNGLKDACVGTKGGTHTRDLRGFLGGCLGI